MPDSKHKALHTLFKNKTPLEQQKHLLQLNLKAISDECYYDILRVLEYRENQTDDLYKNNIKLWEE